MTALHMNYLKYCMLGLCLGLSACSAPGIQDYSDNRPVLVPEQFFKGALTAHGVVKNRQGKVIRWFNANIQASWENGTGTLDEMFEFNDGEQQTRLWTLVPAATSEADITRYQASAGDVKGTAEVAVSGNAMFLQYTLMVPYKGKTIAVTIDDRMYLVDDNTIINQSVMTKWGFKVGEIVLTIRRN